MTVCIIGTADLKLRLCRLGGLAPRRSFKSLLKALYHDNASDLTIYFVLN